MESGAEGITVFRAPCCGPRAPRPAALFWLKSVEGHEEEFLGLDWFTCSKSFGRDSISFIHFSVLPKLFQSRFQTPNSNPVPLSEPPAAIGSVPTPATPVKPVSPPVVRPGIIICGMTPKASFLVGLKWPHWQQLWKPETKLGWFSMQKKL